jgi:hypothetical protein
MPLTNHRIERLAEHFLSEPLENLAPRQLKNGRPHP